METKLEIFEHIGGEFGLCKRGAKRPERDALAFHIRKRPDAELFCAAPEMAALLERYAASAVDKSIDLADLDAETRALLARIAKG